MKAQNIGVQRCRFRIFHKDIRKPLNKMQKTQKHLRF